MTLNPSEVIFDHAGRLIDRPSSPWRTKGNTTKVQNEIFHGVLKLGAFCIGRNTADVSVEIIRGPVGFIGKTAEIKIKYLQEAMEDQTLLSDAIGYYLEDQWVFVKRGEYVRLDKYKA